MAKNVYDNDFYRDRQSRTGYSANTVLHHLLRIVPPVSSAVDIGCGVGTWLSVLEGLGATDILGVDGPWVPLESLTIRRERFLPRDLDRLEKIDRRFDLAICLEVAEHLPVVMATQFVRMLTELSDFVLFSAAIPKQNGIGHVNEQWPAYWHSLFAGNDFECVDFVRMIVWNDGKVPYWYRQNILLYVRQSRLKDIKEVNPCDIGPPRPLVHPDLYSEKIAYQKTTSGALRLLLSSIKQHLIRAV